MNRKERRSAKGRGKSSVSTYPRITQIIVENHAPADVVIGPPQKDGTLQFLDRATGSPLAFSGVQTGVFYPRPHKPKILTLTPQDPEKIFIGQNQYLISQYDHVLAVDTNTDLKSRRSACVVTWLKNLRLEHDGFKLEPIHPPAFVFSNVVNPEKFGWKNALLRISTSPDIKGRVALFVDAYMEELPLINRRELPVLNDFFLPDGVVLLYATADSGATELIGPAAMRICDRVARKILQMLPEDAELPMLFPVPEAAVKP
jgi:hypothetical protein